VSAASIVRESGLTNPNALRVGQVLTIPRESGALYRVQSGDTAEQVAAKWGVPLELVREANGLPAVSATLAPGAVLLIPSSAATAVVGK
jgi:LysM repeat protein